MPTPYAEDTVPGCGFALEKARVPWLETSSTDRWFGWKWKWRCKGNSYHYQRKRGLPAPRGASNGPRISSSHLQIVNKIRDRKAEPTGAHPIGNKHKLEKTNRMNQQLRASASWMADLRETPVDSREDTLRKLEKTIVPGGINEERVQNRLISKCKWYPRVASDSVNGQPEQEIVPASWKNKLFTATFDYLWVSLIEMCSLNWPLALRAPVRGK